MNLLRLYCPLAAMPVACEWILFRGKEAPLAGRSALRDLPKRVDRIEVVLPATDVLIVRTKLPVTARRTAGPVLGFAVEEKIVSDPEANQVGWLGRTGEDDLLTVVDKGSLGRWRKALGDVGIRRFELYGESLMLPLRPGEWSLSWNSREGFVRTGELEAMVTDASEGSTPPLALRMLIEQARRAGTAPTIIALYLFDGTAAPDIQAWESALQVTIRPAGTWDWKKAGAAGQAIAQETPGWLGLSHLMPRLRVAAWVTAGALVLHGTALAVDWVRLSSEQRTLRQQMDARFRAVFPDAVAVVDPLLQMRRKLAEARHIAGKLDGGDFLPMIGKVGKASKELPSDTIRVLSYDAGRLTLEASPFDESALRRLLERLRQEGLSADGSASGGRGTITVKTP